MAFNDVQKVSLSNNAVTYHEELTSNVAYTKTVFPCGLDTITLSNDSTTDSIRWSFDGATVEGTIKPNESITVNVFEKPSIWIRGLVGGSFYRLWGQ